LGKTNISRHLSATKNSAYVQTRADDVGAVRSGGALWLWGLWRLYGVVRTPDSQGGKPRLQRYSNGGRNKSTGPFSRDCRISGGEGTKPIRGGTAVQSKGGISAQRRVVFAGRKKIRSADKFI